MEQPPDARRRRDRRGRGMRGPLAPSALPMSRTRSEAFDDLVLDAVEHLEQRWAAQLERVQFAVEDVPPPSLLGRDSVEPVPLGWCLPSTAAAPAQVVLYRRPIEARATGPDELAELVHDVVVEEVAELLGLEPEAIDPSYGEGWDDDGGDDGN
ncbi:MAG TPA: metallopeptidase family protein [Acidothermaceae bacterium]|nr:metallopeptidase family protein [Acidothermaceae bacterium]